jgi:hypothetical protein
MRVLSIMREYPSCRNPTLAKCEDETHTPKVGDLVMRPQVPCVTQKGSKELDLRKWLKTWYHSQLPALKGVEGSCWKLRD